MVWVGWLMGCVGRVQFECPTQKHVQFQRENLISRICDDDDDDDDVKQLMYKSLMVCGNMWDQSICNCSSESIDSSLPLRPGDQWMTGLQQKEPKENTHHKKKNADNKTSCCTTTWLQFSCTSLLFTWQAKTTPSQGWHSWHHSTPRVAHGTRLQNTSAFFHNLRDLFKCCLAKKNIPQNSMVPQITKNTRKNDEIMLKLAGSTSTSKYMQLTSEPFITRYLQRASLQSRAINYSNSFHLENKSRQGNWHKAVPVGCWPILEIMIAASLYRL